VELGVAQVCTVLDEIVHYLILAAGSIPYPRRLSIPLSHKTIEPIHLLAEVTCSYIIKCW